MTIPITPILWTLVIRGFTDPLWTTLVTFINQRMTLINCASTRIWIVHQFGRWNFWCFLCNLSLYMLNLLIFNVFLFDRLLAFQFASADSKRTWFWSCNLPLGPLFLYILLKDCFDNADQGLCVASSTCWYGCTECKVSRLLVELYLIIFFHSSDHVKLFAYMLRTWTQYWVELRQNTIWGFLIDGINQL
jgi:hypothetical protein